MLYNFLNFFSPYAWASMIIGAILLLISNIFYSKDTDENPIKCKKVINIIFGIGEFLFTVGVIFKASLFIASIAPTSVIEIFFIKIGGMIAIGILLLLIIVILHLFLPNTYLPYCIIPLALYLIFSIVFSILLYPDYKITEVEEDNVIISQEIRTLTTFNDIPLTNISGHFVLGNGEISTSDYLTYWYVDENGDVIYGKALAYNSVKKPQEDGNYHVAITTYATVTKSSTIHKTFDDEYSNKHIVNIFYLPPELVGTLNNN